MMQVAIVEDDLMVASINSRYLSKSGRFEIAGIFQNGEEALLFLREHKIDLVILDIYMPGMNGLELLRAIRSEHIQTAVIMVTAATEMRVVREALQLGIVDYLIKPYSFERFEEAINRYLSRISLYKNNQQADQSVVDRLLQNRTAGHAEQSELRKGLNSKTLQSIYDYMTGHPDGRHTCESLSQSSGLSKVTVRRYLNYLIETEQIASSIDYETGGRPRVLYHLVSRT